MEQSRCFFLIILLCMYLLKSPYHQVDAHILVYRRLTNQLIEEYYDLPAQFGPELSSTGIKVFAIPSISTNDFACDKISPPPSNGYPSTAKFAAIIQRGGVNCTFELKVRNAQEAQFDAVIVYNNASEDLEHMSAENASGIMIPAVFVGHTTGKNLKSFYTSEIILVINDELPFNINTQLILPFSILIGACFLLMIFYMIYKCIREERRARRHRLPKRLLKRVPIVKITKNTDLGYDICVICLDKFSEGEKVRILPCKHPYHCGCIDVWLTENKRECPICKRKVFLKSRARPRLNLQSSLDSSLDTDDDTRPLLQRLAQVSDNSINASTTPSSTTSHGTFRRGSTGGSGGGVSDNNIEAGAGGDVTTDDENMLTSPAQRINPFDRSPNLPPHLAAQLNNGTTSRSIWSWPVLRWFRRPMVISIAAPPFHEDILNDVVAGLPQSADPISDVINTSQTMQAVATHSSNNVLNPSLSGSFRSDKKFMGDDDASVHCIYEPVETVVRSQQQLQSGNASHNLDSDSVFIQTPTQGGIAVAALPHASIEDVVAPHNSVRGNDAEFW